MASSEMLAFSSSSIRDSAEFDVDLSLSDRLKVFKTSHFDQKDYITSKCLNMTEKVSFFLFFFLNNLHILC